MRDSKRTMNRRQFFNSGFNLMGAALIAGTPGDSVHWNQQSSLAASAPALVDPEKGPTKTPVSPSQRTRLHRIQSPLAITMWDFSWLERRWPGAGYEDWDLALDGLVLRGYDAVRIDAYPHLVAANPSAIWELIPCWDTQ